MWLFNSFWLGFEYLRDYHVPTWEASPNNGLEKLAAASLIPPSALGGFGLLESEPEKFLSWGAPPWLLHWVATEDKSFSFGEPLWGLAWSICRRDVVGEV